MTLILYTATTIC